MTIALDGCTSLADLRSAGRKFSEAMPHQDEPYCRRNWGGQLHSLCSYQGKLKPAIAHFLISSFTLPGDRILDPMGGVGTIPLEARRLGRVGLSNDLSPLADIVARSKLETFSQDAVCLVIENLLAHIRSGPTLKILARKYDIEFGLNGPISGYFHQNTLRELLIAREFLLEDTALDIVAKDVVRTAILHILHGNRPYALSRNSHSVTPFAPTGEFEYRSLEKQLQNRLRRVLPVLADLAATTLPGSSRMGDFRSLEFDEPVDAVITSPPFSNSLKFSSSNWMRLWFAGWEPEDFNIRPHSFMESQQQQSFEVYEEFARAMHRLLVPGGLLIMHLGETASSNMVEEVKPYLERTFEIAYLGRENVETTESHGLTDKGATKAHWYLFARAI